MGVEDIPLFPFCPYPGSAIYDDLRARELVPEMSNEYFASLGFEDLTHIPSVHRTMSTAELGFYRLAGMVLFIVAGYARHPSRFLRTIRNLVRGQSDSAVEHRLDQLVPHSVRRILQRFGDTFDGRSGQPEAGPTSSIDGSGARAHGGQSTQSVGGCRPQDIAFQIQTQPSAKAAASGQFRDSQRFEIDVEDPRRQK